MTIGILGGGALGQLFAHQLAELNEPVVLLTRPEQSCPERARPEHSRSELAPQRVQAEYQDMSGVISHRELTLSPSNQAQDLSLILVLTKAQDCVTALTPLLAWLPISVPIVLLHNGMGPQQQAAQRWPKHNWWAGSVSDGALRLNTYKVRHTGLGVRKAGALNSQIQASNLPSTLAKLGFCHEPDILAALWQKLTVNLVINPLTTRDGVPNGELLNPHYRAEIQTLCQEIAQLSAVLGYHDTTADIVERVLTVAAATAHNRSSMLQDKDQNRPLELPAITGYLLAQAQQYQRACPLHRALYQQLQPLSSR